MKIYIGCVDGKTYKSKRVTDREVQRVLDESKGFIGTGNSSSLQIKTVGELKEWFDRSMINKSNYEYQTVSITQWFGRSKKFNVCHIVWWDIR